MKKLTYTDIMEKVEEVRNNASTMLRDGVKTYLKSFKSEKESPYFYDNIADLYQNYQDDIFEADIIEAFNDVIWNTFNCLPLADDTLEGIKENNYIKFLISLKNEAKALTFLKSLKSSEIDEVMNCLKRILTTSYWNLEE